MRTAIPLILLVFVPFSNADGQTHEEKAQFVHKALKRVSSINKERETELTAQIESLRVVEGHAKRSLENAKAEKSKSEKSIVNLAEFEISVESAYISREGLRRWAELREEASEAEKRLPDLTARETRERIFADAVRSRVSQKESDLKTLNARDASIEAELRTFDSAWRSQATDGEFRKLLGAITVASKELALTSTANITSQNSSGPTTGIRVRFQGDDERRNGTVPRYSGLTGCEEKNLDLGYYYFWTERNGRATSDPNYMRPIVDPVEKVQLLEDR